MSARTQVILRQTPFLRVQRTFPQDAQSLSVELDKCYVDIANAVNARTIGVYPKSFSAVTGNVWYLGGTNERQQTLRRVYTFLSAGPIPHNIDTSGVTEFVYIGGSFKDNSTPPKYFPLPFVSAVAANNQVEVNVDSVNINIVAGAGSPPTISSGVIVLEWLSAV